MEYYQTVRRYDGYLQALADHGIEYQEGWLFDKDYNLESGYKSGMELFARDDRPTAVCCVSDMVAIGAIRAAEDSGLRVPEDVSIMGFDDIPIAERTVRKLRPYASRCTSWAPGPRKCCLHKYGKKEPEAANPRCFPMKLS